VGTIKPELRPGLYAITDNTLTPPDRLMVAVEAALEGGATLIQYRDKISTGTERLRQAAELNSLCSRAGVPLLINDDPELALRIGAAGVHLGQEDCGLAKARRLLGPDAIIGITCHQCMDLARHARAAGADYLAFGRFYTSATKPDAPTARTSVLTEARTLGLPVTAIGGISTQNAATVIRAGADLIAVVGGLFDAPPEEIRRRAQAFTRLVAGHHILSSSTQ